VESEKWRLEANGNFKLPITNFNSVGFLFADADIFYATAIVLPFRQYPVVVSLPAGR